MAKKIKRYASTGTVQVHYRSAVTGRYVTKRYAEKNPRTTVKEMDRKKN